MKKIIDIRILTPNLITLTAICAGLTAIRFTLDGNFNLAMIAILVAALLDGLDGRVARALKATSRFGAELDSLADVINFGVVPALILYIWGLKDLGNLGWLACLSYTIAIALRLARFNVMDLGKTPDEEPLVANEPKAYFIGVPAPVAAIIVMLPIYLSLVGAHLPHIFSGIEALYAIIIAGFTISTLKTFSIKAIRFSSRNAIWILCGIAFIAALLFSYTWFGLALICSTYLVYLHLILVRAGLRFYKLKYTPKNNDKNL